MIESFKGQRCMHMFLKRLPFAWRFAFKAVGVIFPFHERPLMNPRYGFQQGSTHPAVAGANHRKQELAPTVTPDLVHPTALCGEWAFFLTIHFGFDNDGHNVSFQPSAISNQYALSQPVL